MDNKQYSDAITIVYVEKVYEQFSSYTYFNTQTPFPFLLISDTIQEEIEEIKIEVLTKCDIMQLYSNYNACNLL